MKNKGFTLVELIVTITLLSILSTLAFISFSGYQSSARDSIRLQDVNTIEKQLELYKIKEASYLSPLSAIDVTYNSILAWTQGTINQENKNLLNMLGENFVDPLTGSDYAYSITADKKEYQIGTLYEGSSTSISQTAPDILNGAYVKGNYNGKILTVTDKDNIYLLAVPSILSSDLSVLDIQTIINNDNLVYNGFSNIPSSYQESDTYISGNLGYSPEEVLAWSGTVVELNTDINESIEALENIQNAYEGTTLIEEDQIDAIFTAVTPLPILAAETLNKTIGTQIDTTDLGNWIDPNIFISTWDVSIDEGVSGFNNLKLPLNSSGNYDFTVDWGDGTSDTITSYNQTEATHSYENGGVYIVKIDGKIDDFGFKSGNNTDDLTDADKIIDISQWGDLKLYANGRQFHHAENLTGFSATDKLDTSNITSLQYAFYKNTLFNANIDYWDVSNVTNLNNAFYNAKKFNSKLNNWDTSEVSNISGMFFYSSFNKPLNNWDTSKVTRMNEVFFGTPFNQDISNWDTSKVTSMYSMFFHTPFNQDISKWDTSEITSMKQLFSHSDFNQDIGSWKVGKVKDMETMFGNSLFNKDISRWDTSNVEDMSNMFSNNSVFNQDLSSWKLGKVTNMSSMFRSATSFNRDITGWDTSNIEDMSAMFLSNTSFNQDISGWNTSNVEDMSSMFSENSVFNQDLSGWNISNVSDYTSFDYKTTSWILPKPSFTE